jgi:transposase
VEIVTRGGRRRSFSAEEKVRLVAETFQLGETVTTVSRRHRICTSLLIAGDAWHVVRCRAGAR